MTVLLKVRQEKPRGEEKGLSSNLLQNALICPLQKFFLFPKQFFFRYEEMKSSKKWKNGAMAPFSFYIVRDKSGLCRNSSKIGKKSLFDSEMYLRILRFQKNAVHSTIQRKSFTINSHDASEHKVALHKFSIWDGLD